MAGGQVQKYGGILQLVGAVLTFIGLPAGPIAQFGRQLGTSFFAAVRAAGAVASGAGYLAQIVGPFVTPYTPDTPSQSRKNSPAYSFGGGANPPKGDAVYPIPFGRTIVRGPVLAAFSTPKGIDSDEDFSKVVKGGGETVSMLVPTGVGRIHGIESVLVDGEPLFRRYENADGSAKSIGTGDGSKTTFKVEAKRVIFESIRVYADDVLLGLDAVATTTQYTIQNGVKLYDLSNVEIDASRDVTVTLDNVAVDGTGSRNFVLIPAPGKDGFYVHTQEQWPVGSTMRVTYYVLGFTGGRVRTVDGGFEVVFTTAPASGVKLTARFNRSIYPGVTIEERRGNAHQLPITGFSEVRQTRALGGEEVTKTVTTFTTDDTVDDVRIAFTTGGPFLAQDAKGRRNPAQANFKVRYKKTTDSTWTTLPDPAGAKSTPEKKNADEFRIVSETFSEQTFHLSIRGILDQLVKRRNTTAHRALRTAFTRARYDVEIQRTNNIKNASNAGFSDRFYALSYTEVRDILLSWPGIALFGFHGVGSKKLSGGFPVLSTIVTGLRDVAKYDGSAWAVDDDAHRNPVWAAVECWTNAEWGGGREGLTKAANVDAASAKLAADWCDASVGIEGESDHSETRALFDATIDTRQSLFAVIRDALLPASVIPVLQGSRLRFVIDQAEDVLSAPVYTATSGTTKRIRESIQAARASRSDQATEIEALYWSEKDDFEFREVFVPSAAGTANRVRKRIELFGVSRRSQAARVAKFIHGQTVAAGPRIRFSMSLVGLRHEAGDVFGLTDADAGVASTLYFRCTKITWPSARSPMVEVEAAQYVLSTYGQQLIGPRVNPAIANPRPIASNSYLVGVGSGRTGTNNGRGAGGRIALRRAS